MTFWRDKTFLTLLTAAVLIAAMGMIRPNNNSGMYEDKFWLTKTSWRNCADVVIGGDSRSAVGVSPAAMRQVLDDARVVNFGFDGNGYSPDYWQAMLDVLDDTSQRKAIILGISPRSLTPAASAMNTFKAYLPVPPSEAFLTSQFSQLLRFTDPMDLSKAFERLIDDDSGSTLYRQYFADGWIASHDSSARQARKLDNYVRDFESNPVDDQIVQRLLERVSQADQMGITIYGFRPPTTAAMEDIEDRLSGLDYDQFVTRFKAAGGVWLNLGENDYFSYDGSHLDRDSAILLSREIAEAIAHTQTQNGDSSRHDAE